MATINFHLRDKRAKTKTAIIMQFNMGRCITLSTGKSIPPKYWLPRKQRVSGSFTGGVEINLALSKIEKDCLTTYEQLLEANHKTSIAEIEAKLKEVINSRKPTAAPGLLTVYQQFLKLKAQEVKPITLKKYSTLQKLLEGFAKKYHHSLSLERIDKDFDLSFRRYLSKDLGQVNDTISKYYDCLKVFLGWASEAGLYTGKGHKDFAAPRSKKDVIFLTEQELLALLKLSSLPKRLKQVRDVFCFQCFTGQRFSDVFALKWTDIKEAEDGFEWHLYQIKGNKDKKVVIPIMPPAAAILERYRPISDLTLASKVLPTISNVKTNEYIKELCQLAGINETTTTVQYSGKERIETTGPKYQFITTHTARRTFVTLSLEKGMSPETIMEVTGHEDYRTMRKYLKIVDKVKKAEMKKAWNNFL